MSLSGAKPMSGTTGHTLMEVVVAIAITSILLVGMASALLIASRAANPVGPTNTVLASSMAAHDILAELRFAIAFTERTATAAEFTVADRNGDEFPETIRYAWSGTPGDPLTRQYNGGPAVAVVQDVREFGFTYDSRQGVQQSPTENESAEQLLLVKDTVDSGVGYSYGVGTLEWSGTYFAPALPGDATRWRITQVQVYLKGEKPVDGGCLVQVRTADAGLQPTETVLDQAAIAESALSWKNFGWHEVSLPGASGLSPTEGVCVVVKHDTGSGYVALVFSETHSAGDPTPDAHFLYTENGGASWTSLGTRDLWIRVWGTYTTETEPPPPPPWLVSMGVRLRAGADTNTGVDGSINVLNQPEVPAP